jgi:hypothetical protein
VAPSNYSSAKRSLNTSEALLLTYGTVSGTVKSSYVYINGSYWRGTVAALRAAMGIASTTRYVGFFAKNVVISETFPEGSDGYYTSTSAVAGGLSWLDLNAVGTRTLYIPAGTVFSFKK